MQENKHTPGPWLSNMEMYDGEIQKVFGLPTAEVYAPNSSVWIAQVRGNNKEEAEANASLIASAPQLAEENATLKAQLNTESDYSYLLKEENNHLKEQVSTLREALSDVNNTLKPLINNPIHIGLMDKVEAALTQTNPTA